MPEKLAEGALWLCASEALPERGRAVVFKVRQFQRELSAFVLRVDGRVVGYLNRCSHVPVEMDWQPGEFWDSGREVIICAIHGATYSAQSGRCVGGPCGRGKLTPVPVQEWAGQVYWYPSPNLSAVTEP
jgi:nitrite reductase/ring-hydroxylating ferredoxin subunit